MKSVAEPIADVIEVLAGRGFDFIKKRDNGYLEFIGTFRASRETYSCEVLVDSRFITIPAVRLLDIPCSLPPAVEHLNSDGYLCYVNLNTVVVDIFDPIGQTLAFLERAEVVFQQIINRELISDLEEEFFAYWYGLNCFVDIEGTQLGLHESILVGKPRPSALAISDNMVRTRSKLQTIGLFPIGEGIPTYRIRTKAKPRPSKGPWPPQTLGEVLQWQQLLDINCRKKIEQRVKEAVKKDNKGIIILIQSPLFVYGFFVFFDDASLHRNFPSSVKFRQFLITPLSMYRIDTHYVTQRNIPGQATLADKKIALVGCGTIGGYLAELLVKAGGGSGGGTLTLVDYDSLLPQNIGRHRLGFPHLLKNKAEALASELCEQMPGISVRALPVAVESAYLSNFDLVIDATGEESISHWLAGKYASKTPLLSVWIEGPGTAVRSLLRAQDGQACPRCLTEHNRQGRFRAVKGGTPQVFKGQGCEGLYVPFPATVSLQAAALAVDTAISWANGLLEPTLKTRLTDGKYELEALDCSPPAFDGCPACST